MSESASPQKISAIPRPAAIVRVTYHQLSLMFGFEDPTLPPIPKEPEIVPQNDFSSVLQLPIILSVTSTVSDKYKELTESTDSLNTFLDNTKNHLTEGIQYVAPLPGKVASALETPLNNVIQFGQNFFNEVSARTPSVTEIKDYFRSALSTVIHWLDFGLVALRSQLAQIKARIEDDPDSKDSGKNSGGKRND